MYCLLDNNQLEDSNNHSNKVLDNIFQYKYQNQKLEFKKISIFYIHIKHNISISLSVMN